MEQQPSELPLNERMNRGVNSLLLIASVFAFPSIVFLHRDLGSRYAGLQALLALVLIFVWPIVDPTGDPRPMLLFLAAFLIMCFVSRIGCFRNYRKGIRIHRYYHGTPRLMRYFPSLSELTVKRVVEPVVVSFVGLLLLPVSAMLGAFLVASAVGLAITISASELAAQERAEAMYDQLIEQSGISERFNRLRGK
ncbi:hypothetical protein [Humisphaera borealis]|uniref:Uncharacterized protein n=1 Tax=Humisphaera borealis TaxID=2807512 RepID=A0A7M2X5J8_9BACT|nr:hypothetical protein [Humisphaera borealis]QOV92080.1 hypothetical protein IPV69_12295 [Humisphaera borealis]